MNQLTNKAKKLFVDAIKIKVQGGKGGYGLPRYGGIGGKGGDVYIEASPRHTSLVGVAKQFSCGLMCAKDGLPARRTRLLGEPGQDLVIQVPYGVSVTDENRQYLGDVNGKGDRVIVALGGRGGDKATDFQGFVGQKRIVRLDLKMIADAVYVGFPNAGKSSLLNAVSNARPKVADYPFTTLRPYLGQVEFPDFRRVTMADLPGLVEGAHKNLGLGHNFLKHIERSRVLIFIIDINGVDLGPQYQIRTPFETLCILNKEIELYNDMLTKKPSILVISKMDSRGDSRQLFNEFKQNLKEFKANPELVDETIRPNRLIEFDEILSISSKTGLNIEQFKKITRNVIDKYAEAEKLEKDKFSTYRELIPLEHNRLAQ